MVKQVGAQTGYHVDDVAVLNDAGGFTLFQAKAALALGRTPNSPPAEALEQVVRQFIQGELMDPEMGPRSVDPSRDLLVLCTNADAPLTVTRDLARAVAHNATLPGGSPLGHGNNARETRAFDVLVDHVTRIWRELDGSNASDDSLRRLLSVLRVEVLDLDAGRSGYEAA